MINPPLLDNHFPPLEQPDPPPEPAPKREECKDKSEYELGQLEANTVASACVFVLAIAIDALCALPAVGVADVPTSLRVTSLVRVALVAAPPVEAGLLFEQRFGAVLLLGAASWIALHNSELHARISDSIYCLVGGWATIGAYAKGGPKPREKGYDAKGQRENVSALAAAFVGYAGMRLVRQGFSHAAEVINFTMEHDDIETRGVAYADDLIAASQVFGGTVCICVLIIVILNHDQIYDHGCSPVSSVLGMLSVMVFTAAFVAQVAFFAHVDYLDVLFGDASCEGGAQLCAATMRARRMYAANSSPASLWACAVGLVIFAFPYTRRCQTRGEYYYGKCDEEREPKTRYELDIQDASNASGWISLVSVIVGAFTVISFTDADSTLRCLELLLLYGSIPLAWFGTSSLATAVHLSGLVIHVIDKTGSVFGFDLSYLTHWSVLVTALLLLVLTVTMAIAQFLYASTCHRGGWVNIVDITTAVCLVGLVSVQLLLTLSSLGITASFGGSNVVLGAQSWPAFGMQWSSQHCLSFFFAAALTGARYEPQHPHIGSKALRSVWFALPSAIVLVWMIIITAGQNGMPYTQVADFSALAVACTGGIVPWTVIGWWLC